MAWVTITETDLKRAISGPELAAFRAVALADGQSDPVAGVIESTVNMVRGYIAACQRNHLGEGNTVPDKLVEPTVDLIIMKIMTRAAGTVIDPNGTRQKNADTANALLKDVARCMFAVEEPEEVTDEIISTFTPSITDGTTAFDHDSQQGL